MLHETAAVPSLIVRTVEIDDPGPLIPLVRADGPLVWSRRGEGMAAGGCALRLEFGGAGRFAAASEAWTALLAAAEVDDEVHLSGSGLIAFGAFAFDDESAATSVLIVPSVVIGRRDGRFWSTTITAEDGAAPDPLIASAFAHENRVSFVPGRMSRDRYRAAVGEATRRIRAGELEKVVLARDGVGRLPVDSDPRRAIDDLAAGYPDCWAFAVDGLIGASPETLVRVSHGAVGARVLAGTAPRGTDAAHDKAASAALLASRKDRGEHEFAVQSLIDVLDEHTRGMAIAAGPFPLELPNLWHLATDVTGELADGSTSLDLLGTLHPTAAVAGTPRTAAVELIRELEPFDRRRYAGPVGWVGADGDGEWAIALRCAQLEADGTLTEYAGAGIVADSDPEHELAETSLKFRPIVEAFT